MSILTRDQNGNATNIFTAGPAQVFTVTNSSVASSAFGENTTHVLVTSSLGHCHIAFGTAPVASVTTSTMMPNNESLYFAVKPGDKIAVIKDAAVVASTLCVTELV